MNSSIHFVKKMSMSFTIIMTAYFLPQENYQRRIQKGKIHLNYNGTKDFCQTRTKLSRLIGFYEPTSPEKKTLRILDTDLDQNQVDGLTKYPSSITGVFFRPIDFATSAIDVVIIIRKNAGSMEEFISLRDFNIDSSPCTNNKWLHLIQLFGLSQLVSGLTWVTETNSTMIDHIYTSKSENISTCFVSQLSMLATIQ